MMINAKWAVTLFILFMFALSSFLVLTLLGVFVEGGLALSRETRGAIVWAWFPLNLFFSVFLLLGRHQVDDWR